MTNLIKKRLRTAKADSAFLYSILEANEGLCFFSTVDYEMGSPTRYLELSYTQEFETQVENMLEHCQKKIKIELL